MASILLLIKKEIPSQIAPGKTVAIGPLIWKHLPSSLYPYLQKLCSEGLIEIEALDLLDDQDLIWFYIVLDACRSQGLVYEKLIDKKQILASYIPLATRKGITKQEFSEEEEFELSRFAFLSLQKGIWQLHCPLSSAEMQIHDERCFALLQFLSQKAKVKELYGKTTLSQAAVDLFLSYLLGMDIIGKQECAALQQWEFHDLMFHVNSRKGRHNKPIGGTYRFKENIPPLPVLKPPMTHERISLYKPSLEEIKRSDEPFTNILEKRASIREYTNVITDKQLGEFLYRSARVKAVCKNDLQDLSKRVYPGGGAIYELELYPVIRTCQGMDSGMYHYDPQDHVLEKIENSLLEIDPFIQNAVWATGGKCMPQVVILIAARFQRLSWKYQTIAYATILKNTGVLIQTMYLVATAMKLAPCGIGSGDSEHFSKVTGLDYYTETTVGEFILGSP